MRNVALMALLCAAPLIAQTTNDNWEPNNTVAQATDMYMQISPATTIAGLSLALGGRPFDDQLIITPNDNDYFRVGQVFSVANSTMTVYVNQTSNPQYALSVQILDSTGATVLAGPGTGTYTTLASPSNPNPGLDMYDGARAATAVTAGSVYLVRVYANPPVPSGNSVNYELSLEFSPSDITEGNYSNNFPGWSPNPAFPAASNPAEGTPSGYGAANAKLFQSVSWRGFDYYMVNLTSPAIITVDLGGFANMPAATTNYDLYWIRDDGLMIPASAPGQPLDGASDSFPNGWAGVASLASVTTPNTSEQITTPALSPGTYYFSVVAWDLSAPPNIGLGYDAGNYDIEFTLTAASDDALEGTSPTENDTAANAATLPAGTTGSLRLLFNTDGTEEDWYKVTLADGENLNVRLTVTAPATDDLNIILYHPNATTPGAAADLVDSSFINNTETVTKGTTTASEVVGTWGSVGNTGNTGHPAGDYLVRVVSGNSLIAGGVPQNGGYSLTVTISFSNVDVAPDDNKEENDSPATAFAAGNTYLELSRGMNFGLKAMDFQDWYRVPSVQRTHSVEITLIYDGGANTDLDVIVFDQNFGPNYATTGAISQLASSFANENSPGAVVTVNGTAGSTWTTAPNTAPIFVAIQRWNSLGASYTINVNINNLNPLPPLRMNSMNINPTAVTAPAATQVTVQVENIGATPADVATMSLHLVHAAGADVTSQYTITGPTPALPATITATSTQNFVFDITSTTQCTNGVVTVSVTATDGNGDPLLGSPTGTFTLSGGQAPAPQLVYQQVLASGMTQPGGNVTLTLLIRNDGTAGGTFGDTPPITFAFTQGATDVTGFFSGPTAPSQTLPMTIAIGQVRSVSWTWIIGSNPSLGTTTITASGGGPDNPATPATVNFNLALPKNKDKSGGGGCALAGGPLWLPLAAIGSLVAMRRRRRK